MQLCVCISAGKVSKSLGSSEGSAMNLMLALNVIGTSSEQYVNVVKQCGDYSTQWQVQTLKKSMLQKVV